MTRKLISLVSAAVLVFTLLLSGCGQPANTPGPAAGSTPDSPADSTPKISVTDHSGRTISLDEPAKSVVVLTAAPCEIVYALGAGSTVVGRGEFCDWPAEALDVPALQSGLETNVEQIIALQPDLVIMATMNQSLDQVRQLENAGIQVYSTDASDIAGTYSSIEQIGTLLGKDKEAAAIVSEMKAVFSELAGKKLSGTIYFEVAPLEYGLWAAGKGSFMDEVAGMIGLTNVFADVDSWAEVSEEQVLQRNPDYILTVGMYFGDGLKPDEEIASRPNWQDVTAVKNSAILNLPDNELSRPGPRLADGAKALYDFVAARSS